MTINGPRRIHRLSLLAALVVAAVATLAFGVGGAQAMPADGGPSANPWIQSDQLDYAPGSTVTLTGGNWQPGESVHILVNDTNGHTWSHVADVTADDQGGLQDVFDLPMSFVSTYDVTATGAVSGPATTTFTDGNVNVKTAGVGVASVSWQLFNNANCSGSPASSGSITATNSGNGAGVPGGAGSGQSLQLTAGAVSGATFRTWSSGNFTAGNPTSANPVCLVGSNGAQNIIVTYSTISATALTVAPATGTFADTVNLSATLASNGTGLSGKTVAFSLNGIAACGGSTGTTCPTTDASGVATLSNAPLAGINAGSYASGVTASFAGDSSFSASNGAGSLTVDRASSTTAVSCPVSVTYTGSAQTPCTANVTGAGGLNQTLTVTHSANTDAGTATATASYPGDANHKPSSDTKTFLIDKASSSTAVSCPVSVTYTGSAQTPCTANVTGAGGLNQTLTVTHSANTDAGTATATASYPGDANHKPSSDTKTFLIDKASSSTAVSCPVSVTYTGSAQTPCTANVTGAGGLNQTLTVTHSANTDAGTATATASYPGDANHKPSSDTKTFLIDKANASVSIAWATGTYTGTAHPASAAVDGVGAESDLSPAAALVYYSGSQATGTPLEGAPTNAGTYTVEASFAGNDNYKPASATKTITIAKATATVSITWADPQTYDGDSHPAAGSVSGVGSPAQYLGTPAFTYHNGPDATGAPLADAPTNAGTYTVEASFAGNDNYKPASATTTITIAKATATVSITWADPQTYDGDSHPAAGSVSGVGSPAQDLGTPAFTYYNGPDATGAPLADAPTNAGTYTVEASFAGNDNYKPASATKTITIAKATATVSITWADPQTYDGDSHPAAGSVSGVGSPAQDLGTPAFTYYNGPDATGAPLADAPTNAGTYTVEASFAGNDNYKPASATKTITIAKATATVSITWADPQTYDGDSHPAAGSVSGVGSPAQDLGTPAFTYYNGPDATGAPLADAPTNAGTYTVEASFAGNDNYKPASATKTITIAKATATVSITWADPQTYDGDSHPAAGSVSGVGSPAQDLGTPAFTYYNGPDATGAPLADAPTNAGTYTVEASFAGNDNYKPASATKTITIAKATATVSITWADPQTYDGDSHPAAGSVSGVGSPAQDLGTPAFTYYNGPDATGAPLADAPTNAGTYTVEASFAGNDNYKPASATKTIDIQKAPSTTTVDCPLNVTYDGSPQTPCTANTTGAGGLDQPTPIDYTDNTNAGTATANATYPGDDNHKPSSNTATFTIQKAPSTTTVDCPLNVTYDGSPQTPCTANTTGAGGLDQPTPIDYTDNTNAGTATANATYPGDDNHKPSSNTATFTIQKAPSTTTVDCPLNVTYDGSPQTPCTANTTGAGGLDQPTPIDYTDNTNAGTATANATYPGDDNHKPSSNTATFTIQKATPSVSVSWSGWTFDGTAHPASGSVSGVGSPAADLGAPDSFTYYPGPDATGQALAGVPTDAGTYTVVARFAGNSNYTAADSAEKTVTVGRATPSLSITWADPQGYNGNPHPATGSVSGVGSPAADLGTPGSFTYYSGSTASGQALATAPVGAGTYTVKAVYAGSGNYSPAEATRTITITKAELTVKAENKTTPYNGSAFTAFSRMITGFAPGDNESAITGTVTFSGNATGATNAGTYTITPNVTGLSAANYTFKPVNGTLEITKVQLTVKADNKSKPFDGLAFTAFTSSISGFVNGENSSVVSGSVTYGGNAVGAASVGTYTITPVTSGLSAANYSFSGTNGTLTIRAWYATGFYDPVGADSSQFVASGGAVPSIALTGVWNTAKGGSTVPLKFNLYNAQSGTQLTTTSSIQSFDLVKLTSCSGSATDDAVDYFTTTGGTSLRYDGNGGQFIQNWKTPSVGADMCYRVDVRFLDGSAIYSFFKLRK